MNRNGMLKPMLVKKFDTVYRMKMGSLSNVKSNMCLMVFLASAEQHKPSDDTSFPPPPPLQAISPTWLPALVDCDMVLKNNGKYGSTDCTFAKKQTQF